MILGVGVWAIRVYLEILVTEKVGTKGKWMVFRLKSGTA